MLASGQIDVKPLITHRYEFENAMGAFEHVRDGRPGTIKVMILNNQ
jgi:threonine dehydrogenase-like Zn-dependent dehydrogenase